MTYETKAVAIILTTITGSMFALAGFCVPAMEAARLAIYSATGVILF